MITEAASWLLQRSAYDYIGVEASAGDAPLVANLAVVGMRMFPLAADIGCGQTPTAVGPLNRSGNGRLHRSLAMDRDCTFGI